MGCFGLDIIELRQSQLERFMRSCGLRLQLVEIDNESVIECWVPKSITTHKPAVLLIHGFVFNATFEWEKQINALQKAFNLFVPNLLFFGRSTTQVEKRSEFFQAECMMKMLQQLNVKEAHVVGTSYGGIVAFRMAHMYPGVVKKVVIASAGVCMKPSTNDPLLKSFNASHVHEILMPNNVQNLKKCMKLATHKPFLFLPTSIYEDFIKMMNHNWKHKVELLDAMVVGSRNAAPLPYLSQDVLILWGRHDGLFNLDLDYELKKHLEEKSKLVVISEAAHQPHIERSKEFNKFVMKFLEGSSK